ncbi:T9SS type A sorting domain-containing protein [Algibacter mikhailovii]|nr:T9SS type A sorting domain-containing protein [Algibacter mikhailovii]
MDGKQVWMKKINEQESVLDISSLSKGTYIIRLSGQAIIQSKLVVIP